MASPRHDVAFVVGALVGSVAGAVYGLLNAPQPGWRTRADLSGYAEELGDRVVTRVSTALTAIRAPLGAAIAEDEPKQWAVTLIEPRGVVARHSVNPGGVDGTTSPTGSEGVTAP